MSRPPLAPLPRLLGIVDADLCRSTGLDPLHLVETLLDAGLPFLWLRCRTLAPSLHLELARSVAQRAAACDVPLVLSDRADIAAIVGCGVHLPSRGLPVAETRALIHPSHLLGVSTHGAGELEVARGADYATLSPVREPLSKPGYAPSMDPGELRRLARGASMPVFALGGINESDVDLVPDFHGLALMGPLHGLSARRPEDVVRSCLGVLDDRVRSSASPA